MTNLATDSTANIDSHCDCVAKAIADLTNRGFTLSQLDNDVIVLWCKAGVMSDLIASELAPSCWFLISYLTAALNFYYDKSEAIDYFEKGMSIDAIKQHFIDLEFQKSLPKDN